MRQDAFRTSLLFPQQAEARVNSRQLADETVKDLGLDEIARRMSREGINYQHVLEILSSPPTEEAVIRYRQDIFEDLYRSPAIATAFHQIIPKISEIALFADTRRDSRSPLQEAIWRLGELELYVECLDTLHEAFHHVDSEVRSQGLLLLRDHLEKTTRTDQFVSLRRELPTLREGLRRKRSVTIGINLDERLRPVDATLISINEQEYQEKSLLPRLFGRPDDDAFKTSTPLHSSPVPDEYAHDPRLKVPLAPLFQDLEQLLGSTVRPMVRVLNRYITTNTAVLKTLQHEAAFYLGALTLLQTIEKAGLPVCKPAIRPIDDRHLEAADFYNIVLALRLVPHDAHGQAPPDISEDLVLNSAYFNDESRIQILTGPNQGGKTTFTQGIGLLQVLAQCGIFVPARSAALSPADWIVTHFPAEERGLLNTGRLGEEAERFARMFEEITSRSVILLNESLTSTSPGEGEYLAEDIVRALCVLGTRGIFATHLHGLAERIESLNREFQGKSRLGSLVAGIREDAGSASAVRTYHIRSGPPEGKSFARDIAEQYGISFDQIAKRLRERNLL